MRQDGAGTLREPGESGVGRVASVAREASDEGTGANAFDAGVTPLPALFAPRRHLEYGSACVNGH